MAVGPKRFNEARRVLQYCDFGVAKAVDRLLAIAHDEDRRLERVGRCAEAFTPAPDQLRHQFPLRAARVLELVHQHVVVARLEAVAAARELVHLLQQMDRPLEHAGEIEQGVRLQRLLIGRQRHGEDAPAPRDITTLRSRRNARTASATAGARSAARSR